MPEDTYTRPLNTKEVLNDPSYINGDYSFKSDALDGLENHNLNFLYNQKAGKDGETGPEGAYEYADEVAKYRSGIRNRRYEALSGEWQGRIQGISEEFDVPADEALGAYNSIIKGEESENLTKNPEMTTELSQLANWHTIENKKIKERLTETQDTPFANRVITNAQGVAYGEERVFTDAKGKTYGVFKFSTDDQGRLDEGDGKNSSSKLLPLKTNLDEEADRLDALSKEQEQIYKKAQERMAAEEKNPSPDPEGFGMRYNMLLDQEKEAKRNLDETNRKLNSYLDGDRGMTNYLHEQMLEYSRKDPGLRERLPSGTDFKFTTDVGIGAAQGMYNMGAAAALVTGNDKTARSLAEDAKSMDMVRSAAGLGKERNDDGWGALLTTTASDQIPMLLGQMALGKLAAGAATKVISGAMSRTVTGATEEATAALISAASKRWGTRVGAFVGSLPTSAQDAAGNLTSIYDRVDELEAQAKTMENPLDREATLKQAQELEDNAAKIFLGHLASTQLLEYIPADNLLKRFADDLPLSAKVLRSASKAGTAAERTAEATAKYEVLNGRLQKFWESKIGLKGMESLSQGTAEGITEVVQALSDNKIAQTFYDENRDITEGVGEGGVAGFFLGGSIGFLASKTKQHSLVKALNKHTAETVAAQNAVLEQTRGFIGVALEDGTVAHPVEHVVKQRPDGKFIIDDPDMPVDADSMPEYDDIEQAKESASNRWENYGKKKIREVYSQTEGGNTPEKMEQVETMISAVDTAVKSSANSANKETIWKSLSQSVQFRDEPINQENTEDALPFLDKLLGNTNSKLRDSLDKYQKQTNEWFADSEETRGPKPQPTPELQAALNFVNRSIKSPQTVEYPNVDEAHKNVMSAIPKMQDAELDNDIASRGSRIEKITSGMSLEDMKRNKQVRKMFVEQKAAFNEKQNRAQQRSQSSGNQGPSQSPAQAGNQNTPTEGPKQAPSRGNNAPDQATLNQGPVYEGDVEDLDPDEVFVFGSNPEGFHGAGSAGFASFGEKGNKWREKGYDKLPAGTKGKWNVKGQGEGLQEGNEGTSYALPTVSKPGAKRSLSPQQITSNIKKMYETAKANPSKTFLVAQGAKGGLNGYSGPEMAKMFSEAGPIPSNVFFNEEFSKLIPSKQEKDALSYFPKEYQQFIKETEAKIKEYNDSLAGQRAKEPTLEEAKTLRSMITAGNPLVNPDGTLNLDNFLAQIPEASPIGQLASLMREVLPLVDAENRTLRFNMHPNPKTSGVTRNTESGKIVVGEGVGSYDTIGGDTTVSEVIGAILPRLVDVIIQPKIAQVKESISNRKRLSKANEKSGWKGGEFTEEAGSPSALELRAIFEIAMPGVFSVKPGMNVPVKSAEEMKRLVVRAELARLSPDALLPESNDLMDAIADGNASVSSDAPGANTKTDYHVQKMADNSLTFFERAKGKWHVVPVNRKAFPREQFASNSPISKMAALYLRQVVSHGYFDKLFGKSVQNPDGKVFFDGLAATNLSKPKYQESTSKSGESVPPYEMTSLSRYLAAMISDPKFSMSQDKGMNWALPIAARETVFRRVIGGMLGADAKSSDNAEVDAIIGASMLAANAREQKKLSLNIRGIPGPTPIKGTTTEHQARLANEAATPGFTDKRYQDTTGNEKNVYYDEDGNPSSAHNEDMQVEASDMGTSTRMERRTDRPYTEAEGRRDQTEGFSRALSLEEKHIANQEVEGDITEGYSADDIVEVNERIASEQDNFFALQLALAEKKGMLKVNRRAAKGEAVLGKVVTKVMGKELMKDFKGESGSLALQYAINHPDADKAKVDRLLKMVGKWMPQEQVDEIAREWHTVQRESTAFKNKSKEATEAVYANFAEANKGRKRFSKEEKAQRDAEVEKARAEALNSITPTGYDPKLFVQPSTPTFKDKVDTSGQEEPAPAFNHVGSPVTHSKGRDVLLASTDGGYSEKELREYIKEMPYGRLNQVHDALVQLAKQFGIQLNDKDTYSNSRKNLRIKVDSLGVFGSLETALYALNKMDNPQKIADYLTKVAFPGNPSIAKVAAMIKVDPTLISDMHALASGFMDSIAYGLKEQGKRVMMRTDAAIFGYGEPAAHEKAEGVDIRPEGVRRGEQEVEEEAVSGPYVALDADSMTQDLANQSKSNPKEYKAGSARSFRMRPTRFSARGASATATFGNGVIPFFMKSNGQRVPITENSKWNALEGRSVGEVYRELAQTFDINADQKALYGIYKDLWRQVFTTSKAGMEALSNMRTQVNFVRGATFENTPLVSPEVSDERAFSPAMAISELINDYLPSEDPSRRVQKKKEAPKGQEGTKTEEEEMSNLDLPEVADADVGLDQKPRNNAPRAQINVSSKVITVFKNGDATSFLHETVHWLRLTKLRDGTSLFQQALGKHYGPFMDWATNGGKLDLKKDFRIVEERIAVGAEEYLRRVGNDGTSKIFFDKLGKKNPDLVEAFKKVGNLFRRIYDGLKSFIQLDSKALNGYDALFGAEERIVPSYNKPIDLTFDEIKAKDVLKNAEELVRQAEELGGQATIEEATEAIEAELNQDGSEFMPFADEGDPITPTDPETVLFQAIPAGLSGTTGAYNPSKIERLRVLFRNGQRAFSKWFIATEGMRWEVKNIMHIKLAGAQQTFEREYLKYSTNLVKSIDEHLGETTRDNSLQRLRSREELHREINGYLTERDSARRAQRLAALPTRQLRRASATIRAHVDSLSDILISKGIVDGPMKTVVLANKGCYLHTAYEIHRDPMRARRLKAGNLNKLYLAAVESISATRGVTSDIAMEIADEILSWGLKNTQRVGRSDPRAEGVGVLMEKENPFPDVALARDLLWGLKTDPLVNYQNTAKQMGHLLQMNAALTHLLEFGTQGPNPLIIPAHQANPSKDDVYVPFFGEHEAADAATDPIGFNVKTRLAGFKAAPEVALFVKETVAAQQNIAEGAINGYMQFVNGVNSVFKMNATVFNWQTGARNFYSSQMTMLGNGHFNPKHWGQALSLVFKEGIGKEHSATNEALMQELMKFDMYESATIAELRDFARKSPDADKMYEWLLSGGTEKSAFGKEVLRNAGRMFSSFKTGSMNIYNGMDTIAKIAAYLGEKDRVRGMRPSWSEAQVQEEASKRTHMTMFSFDMNPKAINWLRNSWPLGAPFVSFTWAMARTSVNILKVGLSDVAEGKKRWTDGEAGGWEQMRGGAARLASFGIVASAGELIGYIARSFFGWDDDDVDNLRKFMQPFDSNGTIIPVADKYGEDLEYVNISNILPYSVLADVIMSFMRDDKANAVDKLSTAFWTFFKPFFDEQYIVTAVRALGDRKTRYGEEINTAKGLIAEIARPLFPGHLTNIARLDLAENNQIGEWVGGMQESLGIKPHPKDWDRKVMQSLGVRTTKLTKENLLKWKAREWLGKMAGPVSQWGQTAMSTNVLPREQWEKGLNDAILAQKNTLKEASNLVETFSTRFNIPLPDVETWLGETVERYGHIMGGGFSKEQTDAIVYGGGYGNPAISITQKRYDDIIEASTKGKQPQRASWLILAEAEGKVSVGGN